jgi:hypothetical protein
MQPQFFAAMKKSKGPKGLSEREIVELLKTVLPKTTSDITLASKIINAVEKEMQKKHRGVAFEKFCERVELPDLEAGSVMEVKKQFKEAFGEDIVSIRETKNGDALVVELKSDDGLLKGEIKVGAKSAEESDQQEIVLKFVSFPVALPADPELVWTLAKRENLNAEEAGVALAKVEEEFWASKQGQKFLRDRVDKTFAEFVSRVPAKMLNEVGLKRHYKDPEAIKLFRTLNK